MHNEIWGRAKISPKQSDLAQFPRKPNWVKFPHSPVLHYAFSSWREITMTKTGHCHWENRFVLQQYGPVRKFYPELAQSLLNAQANICKQPVSLARTETRLEDNTINNIQNSKLLTSQAGFYGKMTNSLISSGLQRLLKFPITMSGEEGDWVHSDFQFRGRYLMLLFSHCKELRA